VSVIHNHGMNPDAALIEHLDAHFIVAIKPSGLLSVPGRGPERLDCLIARVQQIYPDALIVHRLDMATSGLLLLARGATMQRRLSMAFAARQVHKRYIAVVRGLLAPPAEDWGEIELPLLTDWPNRPRQKVCFEQGKPSVTRYRVLAHDLQTGCSRVELEPVTGRTHQLRVHLMSIGHPIVGDALYESGADSAAHGPSPQLLLHATELMLSHPADGHALHFKSAAPF